MSADVSGVFGLVSGIVVVTLVMIVVITVLVVGIIIWTFRRVVPKPGDQALDELKRRLADGEISPVEYEARLDALRARR